MTDTLIDCSSIESFLDGDPDLLADLSVIFVRFLPGSLATLNLAIENRDAEMLRETAHQLKSQLSYFFCEPLIEHARELEALGKSGQMQRASQKAMDVIQDIDRLLEELRTMTNLELNLEQD